VRTDTSSASDHDQRVPTRSRRSGRHHAWALIVLGLLIALSAVYGGIGLILDKLLIMQRSFLQPVMLAFALAVMLFGVWLHRRQPLLPRATVSSRR
jgi:FtsH-binding integral membrane protein